MDRRRFLGHVAAGGTVLSLPLLVPGCATDPEPVPEAPRPDSLFASWYGVDEASISRVMTTLTAAGADIADAFLEISHRNRIVYENGEITESVSSRDQGAGLRVVRGDEVGFAWTEDLTLPGLQAAAREAAGRGAAAPVVTTSLRQRDDGNLYPTSLSWSKVAMESRHALLGDIEARVRAAESAVESVSIRWEDGEQNILVATLDGHIVIDTRPLTRLTLVVTAARGDARQTGFATNAARAGIDWYSDERIDALVGDALERTLIQFEARRAPEGHMPVILAAGTSGVLLHEAIGHALEADFNRDGTSTWSDSIGERVAEPFVTVVDDARLPHESGALNFDDEGSETGRKVLVENGVLRSYVHDLRSARHYGVQTTGAGRRESYRHLPMPRLTCTFMENGPHSRDEIIAAAGNALICETFSGGRAELGSGNFSFEVKNGWLVEQGKITTPTKDFRISGNGPELLGKIAMAADDTRMDTGGWICGKHGQNLPVSHGMPTVLVSGLEVSRIRV
ncbi:MAG: TldD/PmbA family protein [Gammaproteobacteria bacterium]|nr:TldD/PmbA family protein [Gammaproteobacteria bacterium]NNF48275.1 TldD/PmbA family protein [Woeseiaceae bacterium]MBT8093888.1 TldD/PmbA family protein [Gammaproteobacteria bacterium]MBT8104458.1 TldD/PmbA family protein [Gammaproteobacteria bacterium]NNK24474.1 TldD/PmbA family protein [Woeseiaceae bacterium]